MAQFSLFQKREAFYPRRKLLFSDFWVIILRESTTCLWNHRCLQGFWIFGIYFVATCQIGVFKMRSILHPAREPYLVWLMFESKCYKKLEHCLCLFSNSPVINMVRNFLFSDHGSGESYVQPNDQNISFL